jgi:hypothetical protein
MNREKWELLNGFGETQHCYRCRYYKHFDDELVPADDEKDKDKSFCREMRDAGVENYYFDFSHEETMMCCSKFMSDGS